MADVVIHAPPPKVMFERTLRKMHQQAFSMEKEGFDTKHEIYDGNGKLVSTKIKHNRDKYRSWLDTCRSVLAYTKPNTISAARFVSFFIPLSLKKKRFFSVSHLSLSLFPMLQTVIHSGRTSGSCGHIFLMNK